MKRIFAPFERAAQDVNSEGFGLGLFLTKGLIKVLEGKMDVESTLGKGSVFRLELPLPETNELVEEDKSDHNTITILPKNVLVVDDDPIQLKIAEDMLGRKGISCKTCKNAREVVAALENSEYDLVLTDVQMPDTDGFCLLRLLRNSDIGNSRTVPVAVMTAVVMEIPEFMKKKDLQAVFINRSISTDCLLFYPPLYLVHKFQFPEILIFPVYWRIRMIIVICFLSLLWNLKKNWRRWNLLTG